MEMLKSSVDWDLNSRPVPTGSGNIASRRLQTIGSLRERIDRAVSAKFHAVSPYGEPGHGVQVLA
jgi:hypothetical protein